MQRLLVLLLALLLASPAWADSTVHGLATNSTSPLPAGSCFYVDQGPGADTKLCSGYPAAIGAAAAAATLTLGSTTLTLGTTSTTVAGLTLTTPTVNGAALSGPFSGTPTWSGVPVFSGLSTGTCSLGVALDSGNHLVTTACGAGSGTLTSVATTAPISGGTITTTGTISLTGPSNLTTFSSNVIPKGAGASAFAASSLSDNGTTVSTAELLAALGANFSNLTASVPVLTDSSKNLVSGSLSGNTTKLVTQGAGATVSGHQIVYDASGNAIDGGAPGSGGTVTSVATTAPLAGGTITGAGTLSLAGPSNLTTFTAGTVPMGATTSPFAASELTDVASGGVLVGAPTGGQKGAGTLNATGLYVNGSAVGAASFSATAPYVVGAGGSGTQTATTVPLDASMVVNSEGNLGTNFPIVSKSCSAAAYAVVYSTDQSSLLVFNESSPCTVTLPHSTSSVFPPGKAVMVKQEGSANLTVTATTSTIYGTTTVPVVLAQHQTASFQADVSNNYEVDVLSNSLVSGGGSGTVNSGTIYQLAYYPATAAAVSGIGSAGTTTTLLHGNPGGAPTFGAVSLSADVTGSLALSSLATQAANTAVANTTSGTAVPTAVALPSCTDTSGNHLNYTSGTGFSCGTTSSGSAAISGGTGGYVALFGTATTITSGLPVSTTSAASTIVEAGSGGTIDAAWLPGTVHAAATSVTVSAAQWKAGDIFVVTAGSQTFTLPAVSTLAANGSITLMTRNVTTTLAPNGTDTINGTNASVVIPSDTTVSVTYDSSTSVIAPLGPVQYFPLSWTKGQDLSAGDATNGIAIPFGRVATPRTITSINCQPTVVEGGTATIDVWTAPDGVIPPAGGSTKLNTTSCNANTGAGTNQSLGVSSASITANYWVYAIAKGAGWGTPASGTGAIQIGYR